MFLDIIDCLLGSIHWCWGGRFPGPRGFIWDIYLTVRVQVREAGRMGEGDHLLEAAQREERRRQEQVDSRLFV